MKKRHFEAAAIWFLVGFLFLALSPKSDGLFANAEAARDYLVVQTWGGTIDEAQRKGFFEPFTKETGIKVVTVEGGQVGGKLSAMIRNNNIEWDVITGSYEPAMADYYKMGLLEEIDYNIVKNTKDLIPGATKKWGVADHIEAVVLVYNTKVFPDGQGPQSWKDFFNVEKFPGPRAMNDWGTPAASLGLALMSEGVKPDELFPIDFDRAFSIMDKIKPSVKVWYKTGNQLVQALLDEEVVIAESTDGRAKTAKAKGAPIAIVWNQGLYNLTWNCVVKNSPMKDAAMRLIDFCNRPEQQAIFTKIVGYSTTNKNALQYLPPDIQKEQATHPDNLSTMINLMELKNASWRINTRADNQEKWNLWLAQ